MYSSTHGYPLCLPDLKQQGANGVQVPKLYKNQNEQKNKATLSFSILVLAFLYVCHNTCPIEVINQLRSVLSGGIYIGDYLSRTSNANTESTIKYSITTSIAKCISISYATTTSIFSKLLAKFSYIN